MIGADTSDSLPSLGGPYDTVPELCILLSLFESSNKYHPIVFDEAGWLLIHSPGSLKLTY